MMIRLEPYAVGAHHADGGVEVEMPRAVLRVAYAKGLRPCPEKIEGVVAKLTIEDAMQFSKSLQDAIWMAIEEERRKEEVVRKRCAAILKEWRDDPISIEYRARLEPFFGIGGGR